jgi:hypothetical protein
MSHPKVTTYSRTRQKKDSDIMRNDMTTYIDREMRQIGMTADHISQPDKVLFFNDPHFLFSRANTQLAYCLLPDHTNPRFAKVEEPKLPSFDKNI